MKFNISVTRPKGFLHASAFAEVVESLAWALSALGHEVTEYENWLVSDARNILFGAELLAPGVKLPVGTIVYNLEQPTHPNIEKVRAVAKGLTVWDYSLTNVREWRRLGYDVRHVPIGYTPNLTRIPKANVEDIDVLFMGWMTPRRVAIIEQLRAAGLHVVAPAPCYGAARDQLVSRAKIILNVHHDGRELFEVVRVSYMLANSKCVVSERSADDEDYHDLSDGLYRTDVDGIVQGCQNILEYWSDNITEDALWVIQCRNYTLTVDAALGELSPSEKVAARYAAGCESGDMKDFLPWLKEHAKGTILEIGVRDGASTSAFLAGVEKNGGVVLSVDVAECSGLFAGHPQWKFIQADSSDPKLHAPALDILLIDGDHTRRGYRRDLDRFFPFVKPGGLILSHDICPEPGQTLEDGGGDYPSVAVREEFYKFCLEHDLENFELPGKYGIGVMLKSKVSSVWTRERTNPEQVECNGGPECPWGKNWQVLPSYADLIGLVHYHDVERPDSDESWQASEALLQQ